MRARLAFVMALLILACVAWVESRNRYVETNTGVVAIGPVAPRMVPAVTNMIGSAVVLQLVPRATDARYAPGVSVLTVNPNGSSSWKSY